MKKFNTSFLFILLVMFFQLAWAEPATYTQDKQTITVTSQDPTFIIKLKSNPTTGYSWVAREYDSKLLEVTNHQYQRANNKLMGAPGLEYWTFNVKPAAFIVPHQTVIKFVYARPWEHDAHPTEVVFTVSIIR